MGASIVVGCISFCSKMLKNCNDICFQHTIANFVWFWIVNVKMVFLWEVLSDLGRVPWSKGKDGVWQKNYFHARTRRIKVKYDEAKLFMELDIDESKDNIELTYEASVTYQNDDGYVSCDAGGLPYFEQKIKDMAETFPRRLGCLTDPAPFKFLPSMHYSRRMGTFPGTCAPYPPPRRTR